jgi:hypothetical protein
MRFPERRHARVNYRKTATKAEPDQTQGQERRAAPGSSGQWNIRFTARCSMSPSLPEWRVYLREWPGNLRENG